MTTSKPKTRSILLAAALMFSASWAMCAEPITLTVHTDRPGPKINPAMWGIFFEDINFGADGGLYAELVKNRSFEFPDALMGWSKLAPAGSGGSLTVHDEDPFNPKNPHYLRVKSDGAGDFGLSNEGFRGMGIKEGETYDFSTQVRAGGGRAESP